MRVDGPHERIAGSGIDKVGGIDLSRPRHACTWISLLVSLTSPSHLNHTLHPNTRPHRSDVDSPERNRTTPTASIVATRFVTRCRPKRNARMFSGVVKGGVTARGVRYPTSLAFFLEKQPAKAGSARVAGACGRRRIHRGTGAGFIARIGTKARPEREAREIFARTM